MLLVACCLLYGDVSCVMVCFVCSLLRVACYSVFVVLVRCMLSVCWFVVYCCVSCVRCLICVVSVIACCACCVVFGVCLLCGVRCCLVIDVVCWLVVVRCLLVSGC